MEPEENATNYDPSRYERPSVTVDVVIFTLISQELHVLLVQRRRWPFEGYWAIPGGFIEMDESLEEAARAFDATVAGYLKSMGSLVKDKDGNWKIRHSHTSSRRRPALQPGISAARSA